MGFEGRRQAQVEGLDRVDAVTQSLLVVSGIYPPDHGGPARFVPALAAAAVDRGWRVRVITLGDVKDASVFVSADGQEVHTFPRAIPRAKRVPALVGAIAQGLRESNALFTNGLYEEAYLATRLVRRPWTAKVVGDPIWERATNSGRTGANIDAFQAEALPFGLNLQRRALTLALRTANLVTTPSLQLSLMVERWNVPRPIVIPNGVPILDLSPANPDFDVVTVCRLVPWKGVDVLIEACTAEGLRLRIVGDGPLRHDLEQLASELDPGSLVTFSGAVSPHKVRSIIESGRLFALNSSYEGMSFALLEAKERAVPVVVGANPGNSAVVRSGVDGLVVDPRSVSEVRGALSKLVDNPPLARSMGLAGRQDVIDRFSIQAATGSTLDAIEATVGA